MNSSLSTDKNGLGQSIREELEKITSIQSTELKLQILHYLNANFVVYNQEQRYHFILGGANSLLNSNLISEDDFYSIERILDHGPINSTNTPLLKHSDIFLDHSKDGISLPLNKVINVLLDHYKIDFNYIEQQLIAPTLLKIEGQKRYDLMYCAESTLKHELKLSEEEIAKLLGLSTNAQYSVFQQVLYLKNMGADEEFVHVVSNEYAPKWEMDNYGESMFPITDTIIMTNVKITTGEVTLYRHKVESE